MEYQVFISYKRGKDSFVAENLYKALVDRGYNTFLDRTELEVGSDFPKRIQKAIETANVFIILLSQDALRSNYIPKEAKYALRQYWKRKENTLEEERFSILPFILDETDESEFSALLTNRFTKQATFIKYDENTCKGICNLLESKYNLSPPKDVSIAIKHNKKIRDAVTAIPKCMTDIINECRDCPRRISSDLAIQCPLFHLSKVQSDEEYIKEQGALLSEQNPSKYSIKEPKLEDYEDGEDDFYYQHDYSQWLHQDEIIADRIRAEVVDSFESLVGGKEHIFGGNKKGLCPAQKRMITALEESIPSLGQPLFQETLFFLDERIKDIVSSLDVEDRRILKSLGIDGLLEFLDTQASRALTFKKDILTYLVKKEGFDSMLSLLLDTLQKASSSLRQAIAGKGKVSEEEYYSFFLLWWLIRPSSNYLTKSFLTGITPIEKNKLNSAFNDFISSYKELEKSKKDVVFQKALLLQAVDLPEDCDGTGSNYLGTNISDFQWYSYGQEELGDGEDAFATSFLICARQNRWNNPVLEGRFWGLSRGSITESPFHWSSNGYKDVINLVDAIDYLYPLVQVCEHIWDCPAVIPSFRMNTDLEYLSFSKKPYVFIPPFDSEYGLNEIEGISSYDTVIYTPVNDLFISGVSELNSGNRGRALSLFESAAEANDLSAIVYLANLFAFGHLGDTSKALALYEKASSQGVRCCVHLAAQCYELNHEYRKAFWWYLLVSEDKQVDLDTLNLRMGTCCYHLGLIDKCYSYFNQAGEKGQAALYKLKLYSSDHCAYWDDVDDEGNPLPRFHKAIQSLVDEVQPRLGYFSDLHSLFWDSDDCMIDEKESKREELRIAAQKGDSDAQFVIGLYELEDYLSSDAFINHALRYIKIAANNKNPRALCLLGLFLKCYKKDYDRAFKYFKDAFDAIYPNPFPDILRLEKYS